MRRQFVKIKSKFENFFLIVYKLLKYLRLRTIFRSILFWIFFLYVCIGGLSFFSKKYRMDSFLDFSQGYLLDISLDQHRKHLQLMLNAVKSYNDSDLEQLSKEIYFAEGHFVYLFYNVKQNSLITPNYGVVSSLQQGHISQILEKNSDLNQISENYPASFFALEKMFPNYYFTIEPLNLTGKNSHFVLIGGLKQNFRGISDKLLEKMLQIDFIVIFCFFILYLFITIFAITPVFIFIKKFSINNLSSNIFRAKKIFEFNHIRWLRVSLLKSLRKLERFEAEKMQMLNALIKHQNDIHNGKIVSQIIHDLKSPISVFEELLHDKSVINNEELYNRANFALLKVHTLIENIRDPRKEKILNPKKDIIDFSKIISEVSWSAKKKNISIFCKPDLVTSVIFCDHPKLERCIQNLLRNAIYYAQAICQIDWQITKSNELYIEILDDGQGVPFELQEKIFEWRMTDNKLDGTGLGLSYVKFVADIHQGRVSYFRRNNFTVFALTIPELTCLYGMGTNKLDVLSEVESQALVASRNKVIIVIENLEVLKFIKQIIWPENIQIEYLLHNTCHYDLSNCFCIYTDTSADIIERALSMGITVILHKKFYTEQQIIKKIIQSLKK